MVRAGFLELDGWIAGLGTAEGTRAVVGRWARSPWGAFVDVMVERADGRRVLLAPSAEVAAFVATTYGFDEVRTQPVTVVVDVASRTWRVAAGPLALTMDIGGPTPHGRLLVALPRHVSRSRAFADVVDPVARILVPGVRTSGSAGSGRSEWYCASAQHAVTGVSASWDGDDLGGLADVDPPVRFGFSSTPRRPSVTSVRTVVGGASAVRES